MAGIGTRHATGGANANFCSPHCCRGRRKRRGRIFVWATATVVALILALGYLLENLGTVHNGEEAINSYGTGVVAKKQQHDQKLQLPIELETKKETVVFSEETEIPTQTQNPTTEAETETTATTANSTATATTITIQSLADAAWKRLSPTQQKQIENYHREEALIVNFHPTHHAGTSLCHTIGRHGIHGAIAPSFACMGDREHITPDPPDCRVVGEDPAEYCYSF